MRAKTVFFTIFCVIAASLFSCNENVDTNNIKTDVTVSNSDEVSFASELSNNRFDGYNYRIHVRKGSSFTQYFE